MNTHQEICFLPHNKSTKDFLIFFVWFTFYMNEDPVVDSLIMQGIDHLDFRPDKFGNQDIVGMVSAEDEVVAFSNIIYPIDAKVI